MYVSIYMLERKILLTIASLCGGFKENYIKIETEFVTIL